MRIKHQNFKKKWPLPGVSLTLAKIWTAEI
jgi:hypothetical protein